MWNKKDFSFAKLLGDKTQNKSTDKYNQIFYKED